MNKKKKKREDVPQDKEKLSRVSRQRKRETKKKHRAILILVLMVGAVLAAGGIFDIPYINVVREGGSWLGERFSGSPDEEISTPDYAFLTQPVTGKPLGGEVGIILALYKEEDSRKTIIGLVLLTYEVEGGKGEFYIIPENTVVYNAAGEQIELAQALEEEGGVGLLRSTVNNITGAEVDYLVLLEYEDAVLLVQNLGFPSITLEGNMTLSNPQNGDISHLMEGQEVGDADRLIAFLLAADIEGVFAARLERAKGYFPDVFSMLAEEDPARLEEGLGCLKGDDQLDPGPGDVEEERRYLASMIQAFAELDQGKLIFGEVPEVEVLNGCGVPDLGKKVAEKLGALGVLVAGSGGNVKVIVDGEEVNDFSHEKSSIIYRSEDKRVEAYARYLAVLLSITEVSFEPGPGPQVILIAGKDRAG